MNIVRVTNPEISMHLIPWFKEADKNRFEIGLELNERMKENPDKTCVLTAIKDGYIKAILVGHLDEDTAWIWQANKSKDMDRPKLMFHIFCQWAKNAGAKKIQLGTPDKRVRRLYKRKYGFSSAGGLVMEKSL